MSRSLVPPWRRVAGDLRRRIDSGELPPGAPLPSLTALSAEYGLSKTTIRKAIAELREAGLVESVRGWATFVKEQE